MSAAAEDIYLQKYQDALLQKSRLFVVLRQAVKGSSVLENGKQVQVQYVPGERKGSLKIGTDDDEKLCPLDIVEAMEWKGISAASGDLNYIQMSLKGDRTPLILHTSGENMELWYDALNRICFGTEPERASSKTKREMFKKAAEIASITRKTVVEIPPPPEDFNFVADFNEC